jgi:hypothetical protein
MHWTIIVLSVKLFLREDEVAKIMKIKSHVPPTDRSELLVLLYTKIDGDDLSQHAL